MLDDLRRSRGTGDVELYNLARDAGEANNLAVEYPGRLADLKRKLQSWRRSVIARMPIPNPHYDPQRAGEWWNMGTGQSVDSDSRRRFPPTERDL
jgi:uncharacterized sulfatase